MRPFLFHYLDVLFALFEKLSEAKRFGTEFDGVCIDLGVGVNITKKQLRHIVDFLGLEFDTLKPEERLPKDNFERAIDGLERILKKRGSTTHEELQSLVRLRLFLRAAHFSDASMTLCGKYLHWSKPIKDDLLWWEKSLP